MKKNRFFWASAAIAALTLTACADQDEFNQNDVQTAAVENAPGAIQFGTYLGENSTTRAGVAGTITTSSLKTGAHLAGFGVMAYQMTTDWTDDQTTTTPNFMYNEQVIWNTAGYWTYSPVKYWPNGTDDASKTIDKTNAANSPSNSAYSGNVDKVSFFAYAPWVDAATYSTASKASITIPSGTHEAYWATGNTASSLNNGITAFTYNELKAAPEVMYYIPTATTAAGVDLLWGLRGSKQYIETDASDNPASALDNLGSTYNVNLTKQIVPETVDFLFKHALSKIGGNTKSATSTTGVQKCGLKVVLDVDGNGNGISGIDNQPNYLGTSFNNTSTLVTIKSVNIRDGASIAGNEGVTAGTKSNLKNSGWFNLATGSWNNVGIVTAAGVTSDIGATYSIEATTSGSYKLDPDIAEPAVTPSLDGTDKNKWASGTGIPNGVVTTTAKNVYSNETDVPALLLIPNGSTAQTIYITTEYVVRTADEQLASGYSEATQKVTNSVELIGLDVNKYYTLVMHLGLTSIKFSAVVADWANTDDATYGEDGTHDGGQVSEEEVWLPSNVVAVATTTSPALGSSSNANSSASNNSYTITLSGLEVGQKITATESADNIESVKIGSTDITTVHTLVAADFISDKVNITVTLKPNTKVTAVSNLISILQEDASDTDLTTTSVNIVQSAFDIVLSETTAGKVVSTKDGDGNDITTSASGYTVTIKDSEGATLSSGYTIAAGSITMTTAGTYTVTVSYTDSESNSIARTIDIKE